MILTHEEAKRLRDDYMTDPFELIREVEQAVIAKLAQGVDMPKPAIETTAFSRDSSTQHYCTADQMQAYGAACRLKAQDEIEAVRKANIDCVNHFDALSIDYDAALARLAEVEGQQPVARLHVMATDTYPDVTVEVLDGERLQPKDSPINIYVSPLTAPPCQINCEECGGLGFSGDTTSDGCFKDVCWCCDGSGSVAAGASPAQPSDWETAMLDGLAAHCIDAPVGTPPRDILAKIIAAAIEIDRDPQVSDRAQPSQAHVAEIEHHASGCVAWLENPYKLPRGTKIYAAPVRPIQAGEPVDYQIRMRPLWGRSLWTEWSNCTKGIHDDYKKTPILNDWEFEVRALSVTPQGAQQPSQAGLSDKEIDTQVEATIGSRYWSWSADWQDTFRKVYRAAINAKESGK